MSQQVSPSDSQNQENQAANSSQQKSQNSIWPWVFGILLVAIIAGLALLILNWVSPQTEEDESWEKIKLAGVLRVATSADYPPFAYYNQNFAIDGYDAALAREIGNKLGIQVQITDYAFESLGPVLNIGQSDVVIAATSVTPEREAVVDFSNIYYIGKDGILARSDSGIPSLTNIGQLAGMTVGVQRGTVYETWAQDALVNSGLIAKNQLYAYAKTDQLINDLKTGGLNVVILDVQPAIHALADAELKLVGEGLNLQRYAVALPKGSAALKAKIDQALLELQNEGKLSQLAQDYLGLRPEDIIPPPTCSDAMEFVKDINLDDEDLSKFPEVKPGEKFQKGWQIKNTGTCTWSGSYFIKYVRGNDPAAQMGGQPTVISSTVEPGQTYDMYVNLVAPEQAGKFVGYWQMHNAESIPFGQTIWVAVQVPGTPPTPTETEEVEPPVPTATSTSPAPTATEAPPEPTATEVPPEATATLPPEPTQAPGEDLLGITWVLESYRVEIEDEELTDPIKDVDLLLAFDEFGNFAGDAGCNKFTGRYVTNGTDIILSDMLLTKLFCEQPAGIMDQETIYVQWLERAEEYRIVMDNKDNEHLEMVAYVLENNQKTEKVLLVFYDQLDGPPEK